jgi:hypothetical protein
MIFAPAPTSRALLIPIALAFAQGGPLVSPAARAITHHQTQRHWPSIWGPLAGGNGSRARIQSHKTAG